MEEILIRKYNEIAQLFGIHTPKGYSEDEIRKCKDVVGALSFALELFYLKYGKSDELQNLQDFLILPNKYKVLLNNEYIIFFNENQGVCQAGIKKTDIMKPDPPVYVSLDNGEWVLSCDSVSDFLVAMFGYQASICLKYSSEEFYFITPEEKKKIGRLFKRRPESFKNWIYDYDITLYGDDQQERISLMETEGSNYIQMNYAANTEEEFNRMRKLLSGIGETM